MSLATAQPIRSYPPQARTPLPKRLGELCVISLLFLSITCPPIPVTSELSIKVEHVLVLFIVAVYGWLLLAGLAKMFRFNGFFIVGAIYTVAVSISIWYGSAILNHSSLLRDYYEIPKLWLPIAFFTLAYESELSEASLRRLLKYIAAAVLLVCLYGWAQFLNLGFTHTLNTYYSGGAHHDRSLEILRRVYSTMGNPNVLGELMAWMLMVYIMAFLFKVGNRFLNVAVALSCLATIVMTASRYALLMALLAFGLILALATTALKKRAAQIALLVLILVPIFVATFLAIELKNQSTMQRFDALKHPLEVESLRERMDKIWVEAVYYYELSPWVGHGPAKALFIDVWDDCEYLGILKRYGTVGFFPYIAYYLFPMFLIWKGLRAAHQRAGPLMEDRIPATYMAMRMGFAMTVMALVMNIGMSTFSNDELQAFLWLWLGLAARAAQTVVEASNADPQMFRVPRVVAFAKDRLARQPLTPRWTRAT
ncbi:MAG: O-antigen ligase family protein [Candidatus Acidiferrales bacterium]